MKLGILADIHEDITRLQEAITLLKNAGCEKLVCLGDIVGYSVPYYGYLASRSASQVIRLVQENCDIVVAGNHDLYAAKKVPTFTKDFAYPDNRYNLSYAERTALADDKILLYEENELSALLSVEEENYIKNLPEYAVETFGDNKILFSHRLFPDLSGSTKWEAKDLSEYQQHFEFMEEHQCNVSIVGHDHRLFGFTQEQIEELGMGKSYIYTEKVC
jgi:predicted phosphodiesterase